MLMLGRLVAVLLSVTVVGAAEAVSTTVHLDFTAEPIGTASTSVLPVAGWWAIDVDGENRVLRADGSRWVHDRLPEGLAAAATTLFAEQGAAFAERIRARPDYPLAVATSVADFRGGTISVRFKPLAGAEDRAAGIAFGLGATGDYVLVRANALENNLGLFRVVDGSRSSIAWAEKTPTSTQHWHTLSLTLTGTDLTVGLDGTTYLHQALSAPIAGRVGLWSKADSVVLFDELIITPTHP